MNPILIDVPEVIETERLILRPFRPGDGPELYRSLQESQMHLAPWLAWAVNTPTPESSEVEVRQANIRFLSREDLRYGMFLRQDPTTLVGSTGLHRIDWIARRFEVGYWIRSSYQGRGHTTEAVKALTTMAFGALQANRIEVRCDPLNLASIAVAKKSGFSFEGTLKNDTMSPNGRLRDTSIFALVRGS